MGSSGNSILVISCTIHNMLRLAVPHVKWREQRGQGRPLGFVHVHVAYIPANLPRLVHAGARVRDAGVNPSEHRRSHCGDEDERSHEREKIRVASTLRINRSRQYFAHPHEQF